MADIALAPADHARPANWTVAGIFGLLIITLLAFVPLTMTFLQSLDSDAVRIDLAGRQRMLLERQMKELLLSAQGVPSAYDQTRRTLGERLDTLLNGGTVIVHSDRQPVTLTGAPTVEVRERLLDQRRLLESFDAKADRYLQAQATSPEWAATRQELLADNAVLLETANAAVELLTRYSEARSRRLIQWETWTVLLVVTVASLLIWRFLEAEKALKRSERTIVEALRQSDAMKSALLSSVSHELRTPLTAIKSMLFGLRDDPGAQSSPVRQEFLRSMDNQLDHLNRFVGNLLDMSRLEAGRLKPRREWHVLDELAEGAIKVAGSALEGRVLNVELASDIPPVYVDGMQIQQVLINLLENAVKFSASSSSVRLAATVAGDAIEVSVSDTGEGIPVDELPWIFERFYRARSARNAGIPGTGLGLAICKAIVEAHGGRIVAISVPGKETTIIFTLPIPKDVLQRSSRSTDT
ncbi:MAG TPA: ATP-binding protein [Nitrospira sp.]|nr:ATP-binding protein [Nitrospira sp.]